MAPEEFSTIGLALCTVGAVFLARSIMIKPPRRVVEEFFGAGEGRISSIRRYIDAKNRVIIGCAFLVVGFAVQLVGLHRRQPSEPPESGRLALEGGAVLLLGAAMWFYASLRSRSSLRRYLEEFFRRSPWPFEKHMELTKEIGDLFGIPHTPDDSIEAYVAKVRKAIGANGKGERVAPRRER